MRNSSFSITVRVPFLGLRACLRQKKTYLALNSGKSELRLVHKAFRQRLCFVFYPSARSGLSYHS